MIQIKWQLTLNLHPELKPNPNLFKIQCSLPIFPSTHYLYFSLHSSSLTGSGQNAMRGTVLSTPLAWPKAGNTEYLLKKICACDISSYVLQTQDGDSSDEGYRSIFNLWKSIQATKRTKSHLDPVPDPNFKHSRTQIQGFSLAHYKHGEQLDTGSRLGFQTTPTQSSGRFGCKILVWVHF